MAKNKGTFVIDNSVSEKDRIEIADQIKNDIDNVSKTDVAEREGILKKRQDFFEGRHHIWTNVVGQTIKQQDGHIQVVINYISKFCQKLHQALTNKPPKIKIKPMDEADEVETLRSEAVEEAILKVFRDNMFFPIIFKRTGMNQIRDGDMEIECKVLDDDEKGKHIEIGWAEDLLKILVGWDDAAGSSYSWIAYRDLWTTSKIMREFGYEATPISDSKIQTEKKGSHLKDQYGVFASSPSPNQVPSGQNTLPKARLVDWWGYRVIKKQLKVLNLIFINEDLVQFVVSDYKKIPRWIGHSFVSPGKPWSKSFIDDLIDPQVELNDRTGEEGDLVRVGAHQKFLVVNMSDFDADSVRPGSGQLIYLEGENVDFKPLPMSISTFPSDTYLNRVTDHLFNIGLPKITLSAGTAPYTGRVGAIQYQPFIDIVDDLRVQWEIVLTELIGTIQQYFIDYFPELAPIMREHISDPETGEGQDGDLVIREVQFDWENILPLSRSDKVIDSATLRDRGLISHATVLEEAGFRNPSGEIKKLKKEAADPELMTLREKFTQYSPGVVAAQLEAQKKAMEMQEQNAETMGMIEQGSQPTPKANAPILSSEQNDGRRGVLTGTGTPTGQTASLRGNVKNTSQNLNAKGGI